MAQGFNSRKLGVGGGGETEGVGICSVLVCSAFLKLQHLSLLNASLYAKLSRHLMGNLHSKPQFYCGRSSVGG